MAAVGVEACGINVYTGDVVQHIKTGELFVVTSHAGSEVHLSANDNVTFIYYADLKNYKLRGCGTREDFKCRMAEPCCIVDCSKKKNS